MGEGMKDNRYRRKTAFMRVSERNTDSTVGIDSISVTVRYDPYCIESSKNV